MKYEMHAVTVGSPVQMNVYVRNTERVSATLVRYDAVALETWPVGRRHAPEVEQKLHDGLTELERKKEAVTHQLAGASPDMWFTLTGPIMTEERVSQFKAGTLAVFFMARMVYADAAGTHITEMCVYNTGDPRVILQCTRFNTAN